MLVLRDTTSARDAARALYERRVGSVVVCDDDGKVVGLLTDRDLTGQVLAFNYPPETEIREFMSEDVLSVGESDSVEDVVQLMIENGIRRVPVIRKGQGARERCVGMVSLDDLIIERAIAPEQLRQIVAHQVLRVEHQGEKLRRSDDAHEARLEQSLNRFFNLASRHMGLPRPRVDEVAFHLLSTVVQRLPATGAVQLISQLPRLLQEDLLGLRAGPNRKVTAESTLQGLSAQYGLSLATAAAVMEGFWTALEEFTNGSKEVVQALGQLPERMRALFGP